MIDIKRLPFDLTAIKSIKTPEKLFEVYPVLNDYEEFKSQIPISLPRAFELIVLLYSPKGLLVQRYSTAKVEAAQYFGYKTQGDKILDKTVAELLSCNNDSFNKIVFAYVRMQHSALLALYITFCLRYDKMLPEFATGESDDKTKDAFEILKKLRIDIEDMQKELLSNDLSEELKNELYAEVERAKLGIRPEERAGMIANGEDPNKNVHPFGKDYHFEVEGNRAHINPTTDD